MLQVFDDANAQIGKPVPLALSMTVRTTMDGGFAFRFRPSEDLKAFATANGDFVNFHLTAIEEGSGGAGIWAFPRQIVGDGWDASPPTVTLHLNGAGTQP
jgi:hypothetical protein